MGESAAASVGLILVDARGWILLQLRDAGGIYLDHGAPSGARSSQARPKIAALAREVFEETGYRLSHSVTLGSRGMVWLPDGTSRRAAVFHAAYDEAQAIQCFEGQTITFVDPSTLESIPVYPG